MGIYPQVDYGQGGGAWVPATRGPVYQAMERARFDPAFARLFAADILFGREESGGHYWQEQYEDWYRVAGYQDIFLGGDYTMQTQWREGVEGWLFEDPAWGDDSRVWRPKGGVFDRRTWSVRVDVNWLYNQNTLNGAKTWVAQLFGPAAALDGATWRKTGVYCTGSDWGFVPEDDLTGDTLRMVVAGHVAFTAVGCNGVTVRVAYAPTAKPFKDGRGRYEAGNSKKSPQGRYYQ